MKEEVLIIGAGPTGLAMAIGLEKQGVSFRIVDKKSAPGTASRAMAVQARVLESYYQFGIDQEIIQNGIIIDQTNIIKDREKIVSIPFGSIGGEISPYPYVLSIPQDVHERILVKYLESKNISIEWDTEVTNLIEEEDYVDVILNEGDAEENQHFKYICGCDGAHSIVRKQAKIDFPGDTYNERFFVADVEIEEDQNGMSVGFRKEAFCLAMNICHSSSVRLIGIIPKDFKGEEPETFHPIIPYAEKILPLKIRSVNWYSPYKIHCRVAEKFKSGRLFLLGDAGHIHSPAGGQGMNTGIMDAFNLSWKLAFVLKGKLNEDVLRTYEEERIAFAKSLVSTTDKVFQSVVKSKILKNFIIPYIVPKLSKSKKLKTKLFKVISQVKINYRDSILSKGRVGKIKAGDRLPWIQKNNINNYDALKSVDWQIHVYGKNSKKLNRLSQSFSIPVHYYKWSKVAKRKKVEKNSIFLVRPDGYIAVVITKKEIDVLKNYLNKLGLK
ncbi:pentachlorophenol-4-monooxygenase [Oceanobacillus iheyensis HTE831]|uniref:Pentachlorophenol-4-monooxygenase n=1 Tax=Oceanobacillus iheyensis (strain DSM 14371 / CIP 107618 / JCM 11309 / KCTC 3954 / HTE831) TaxID=221109 RepID=Q8ESJ6_OCEIH|nr:FAD-dependent monooxygenase [Oceanobacillus iheyensis]BAC12594.1 pentachlorophenol-4-monooxygenase [Oceanobacillus iheyensis HTE831]